MTTRKIKKENEFGSTWDPSDPMGMHEKFGNMWIAWVAWAFTLEEAEVLLGQRATHEKQAGGRIVMPMLLAVRAMLLGYAIECLLKALWLRKGNELVRNGKYRGVAGSADHNLLTLSQAAGFVSTTTEGDVLRRLSSFVRFAGRYPIGKTGGEMAPDTLTQADVGYFSPKEFRVSESVFNKVLSQVSGKKRRGFPRRLLLV